MCHRRIPKKPDSDGPASERGNRFRARVRLGPPNEAPSIYDFPKKLKMLGLELHTGTMPKQEHIDAAISFIYSVRPSCSATASLGFDHIRVLITAAGCLGMPEWGGWDITEFKGMLSDMIEGNPVDRERFREKAEELFSHRRTNLKLKTLEGE